MIKLRARFENLPFKAQEEIATDMKLGARLEGESEWDAGVRWRKAIRSANRVAEADLRMREKKRELKKEAQ